MPKFKLHDVAMTKKLCAELGLPAGVRVSIVQGPFPSKDGSFVYGIEISRPLPRSFKGNADVELIGEEFLEAC